MSLNQRVVIGILAVVALLAVALFFSRSTPPSSTAPLSTVPAAATVRPSEEPALSTLKSKTQDITVSVPITFDAQSLTSTSSYPAISGTAEAKTLEIVIADKEGVGIIKTSNIEVMNGHWILYVSKALPPGVYLVFVTGGGVTTTAPLLINQ